MKVGNQSNNVGHDFSVKGVAGSSRRDGAGLDIGGDTGGLVDAVQRPRQRPTMLDVLPRLKFATCIKQQRKMMPSSHRLGRPSDLTEEDLPVAQKPETADSKAGLRTSWPRRESP